MAARCRANVSVAVGGQRSNFKGVLVACVAFYGLSWRALRRTEP